jgi:tetratricopeptide (TPR) repeat protein
VPSRKGRASATIDRLPSPEESAEQNYIELVMTIRQTQGMFALLPVKSNYSVPKRDVLLQRLADDLGEIPLRFIRLSRESWNPAPAIADASDTLNARGAIVLLGLEETPGIVPAVGEENRRPPALAILNHTREAIRAHCPHPLLVWCDPLTYRALREHAPDFFDYFTGLFSFEGSKDAEAEGGRKIQISVSSDLKVSGEVPSILVRGAAVSLAFYEGQVARHQKPTPERARALLGLAETLWAHQGLDLNSRLIRAEQAVTEAVDIFAKENAPTDWARGKLTLGLIYNLKAQIGILGNPEKAIACFEASLQVYSEAKYPIDWAMAQNGLGIALASLTTGRRSDNLQRAIACFESASKVFRESEFPREWAMTQTNLGIAHRDLPTGARAENLHRAIACYEAALRVQTESGFTSGWAITQNNLGNAYCTLPTGDRVENLRRAIACYEAALRVRSESDSPSDWAATQSNLGNAYWKLPTGDRVENLRRAVACFEAALRIYTETDFPSDWAMVQNNLGNAYRDLPTGDRVENLHRAIAYFEAALRVYTESDLPYDWAATQSNLGIAYSDLPTGDRVENLRRAIGSFEAALRVFMERDFPQEWMMTQHVLNRVRQDLARLKASSVSA